jgi:putative transposase
MGRPLRIIEPYGTYHVVSRGNDRQDIFDDALRDLYLFLLSQVARQFDWWVYAWALMSNHLHLVVQVTDKGLAKGMCELNTRFARASNARFDRINHCLGRRYWSNLLETDEQFRTCLGYVLWNPARAGLEERPGECRWTSYRATVGLEHPREPLASWRLLARFGGTPAEARARFERFVLGFR